MLRRQRARPAHVFFARADHVGYLKQGTRSAPDPCGDDLPGITDALVKHVTRRLTPVSGSISLVSRRPMASLVPAADVQSLNPGGVDPDAVAARSSLQATGLSLRAMMRASKRRPGTGADDVPFVSVLHIDDLGAVAWQKAYAHRPVTPGVEALPGELIVSLLNPRKLRATVIPPEVGPVRCSGEFGVFEAAGDAHEALALLHHPLVRAQLAPLGRGTSSSRRRISAEDILGLRLPALPRETLVAAAAALRAALEEQRLGSLRAVRAYEAIAQGA